jgi:hypothetical protein
MKLSHLAITVLVAALGHAEMPMPPDPLVLMAERLDRAFETGRVTRDFAVLGATLAGYARSDDDYGEALLAWLVGREEAFTSAETYPLFQILITSRPASSLASAAQEALRGAPQLALAAQDRRAYLQALSYLSGSALQDRFASTEARTRFTAAAKQTCQRGRTSDCAFVWNVVVQLEDQGRRTHVSPDPIWLTQVHTWSRWAKP